MRSVYTCLLAFLLLISFKAQSQQYFESEWNFLAPVNYMPFEGASARGVWIKKDDPTVTGTFAIETFSRLTLPTWGTFIVRADNGERGRMYRIDGVTWGPRMNELMLITKWGGMNGVIGVGYLELENAFYGARNVEVTATDIPVLSRVESVRRMFYGCAKLKGNATINTWNTSNITNMSGMFEGAVLFNQSLSSWNTTGVTDMSRMFAGASSFNQSLGTWSLRSATSITDMFTGSGMDCANYSATLVGWADSASTPNGLTLNAPGMVYNASALAAHNYLVNIKGWTITGDTYDAACTALPVLFGDISTVVTNSNLLVNWISLTETNNDHFDIEGSTDGKTFTSIATVKTKAPNGNSETSIAYNWTGDVNAATGLLGSLSLVFLLLGGVKKRNRLFYALAAIILLSGAGISCTKSGESLNADYNGDLYIRIKQVDKDGKSEVSKASKVIQK